MNFKKSLILILFFYFLTLIETSFSAHFGIMAVVPNLVLITVLLLNFFEAPEKKYGILAAFIGGLFLDIFSARPIGISVLFLVLLAIFLKLVLKNYVRIPSIKEI